MISWTVPLLECYKQIDTSNTVLLLILCHLNFEQFNTLCTANIQWITILTNVLYWTEISVCGIKYDCASAKELGH